MTTVLVILGGVAWFTILTAMGWRLALRALKPPVDERLLWRDLFVILGIFAGGLLAMLAALAATTQGHGQ
jgi:hypothetical protein